MKKGLQGKVYPELLWAGASIKDKHREDNTHTDHMDDVPKNMKVVKDSGVLNSDWKQEWVVDLLGMVKPTMQNLVHSISLTQEFHRGQMTFYVTKNELRLITQ